MHCDDVNSSWEWLDYLTPMVDGHDALEFEMVSLERRMKCRSLLSLAKDYGRNMQDYCWCWHHHPKLNGKAKRKCRPSSTMKPPISSVVQRQKKMTLGYPQS